jgi:hypothetical protein
VDDHCEALQVAEGDDQQQGGNCALFATQTGANAHGKIFRATEWRDC